MAISQEQLARFGKRVIMTEIAEKFMDVTSSFKDLRKMTTELAGEFEVGFEDLKDIVAAKIIREVKEQLDIDQVAPEEITPAEPDTSSPVLSKHIADLDLSVRSRKALHRLNIEKIGHLIERTEDELLGVKRFGIVSLNEIKSALQRLGLALKKAPDPMY